MTTKTAILASIGTFIVVMGLGFLVAFLTIDIQSAGAEERFGKIGGATGVICVIPLAAIWIKWLLDQQNPSATEKKERPASSRRTRGEEE